MPGFRYVRYVGTRPKHIMPGQSIYIHDIRYVPRYVEGTLRYVEYVLFLHNAWSGVLYS